MEYAQRLIHEERNISSFNNYGSGYYLFNKTLQGGALASGDSKVGFIREGAYADLVTLSSENPSLIGHTNKTLLDAIIFSNHNVLIDRVMINGQWVNADKSILENYKEALFSVMDYKLIP
jgi:cytosine/adenosine deaminase-related metal-dependent hydrolase